VDTRIFLQCTTLWTDQLVILHVPTVLFHFAHFQSSLLIIVLSSQTLVSPHYHIALVSHTFTLPFHDLHLLFYLLSLKSS